MCGINGAIGFSRGVVERMNSLTVHRGPDGSKIWESPDIILGQNRLSIIDLRRIADQPFISEDGRYVVVFNGELYNYRELRNELTQYSYRTEGDTEVLLNAFRAWGVKCVERFNGIFAFGIWDHHTKKLFIARDHIGVKPLYYSLGENTFVFSSEIKAILGAGVAPVLNSSAFEKYMCLLYTPGTDTLFTGVKRLAPGHTLVYQNGKADISQYYSIPDIEPSSLSRADAEIQVQKVVDAAVNRQLVADVPVGVYLSGGVDSTVVIDSVSRNHTSIDTFSIGYELGEDEESEKFNADYQLAEKTAKYYGTRHHGFLLTSDDLVTLLEDHVWHMDEPIGNLTALAQFKLAEFANQHVKVVLGGDGGDELFGGYKRHSLAHKLLYYWQLPEVIRNIAPTRLRKANVSSWSERYLLFLGQKEAVLRQLSPRVNRNTVTKFFDPFFAKSSSASFLDDMMRTDLSSWLVDESLLRSDKMSMAHGLEQRVPLLDIELVALARSIPSSYKVTLTETKKILKDAFRDRLPSYVFNQPKRGWISPGAKWLRRPEVAEYVKTVLSPSYCASTRDLFEWKHIEEMYELHAAKKGYYLTQLWSVIVFQIWAQRFKIEVEKSQ